MDLRTLNSLFGGMLVPAAKEMDATYVIAVVITGLTVVFLGLIILILFVWAFGKIFDKKTAPSKPQAVATVPKPAPAPEVKPMPETVAEDDDEVIAVISAAVAAMGEASGKSYRLASVRAVRNKPSRSAWSMAGVQNDTLPF